MTRRVRTLDEFIAGAEYWQGFCIDIDAMDLHDYLLDLEEFLRGHQERER
jgi:hypothetical protein